MGHENSLTDNTLPLPKAAEAVPRGLAAAVKSRRPPVCKKVVFSLIVIMLFVVVIEFVLWLAGVRPYDEVRDPFLDFAPGPPLFTRVGDAYRTTEIRLTYFNAQTFAASKPAGTIRVFCLGGSTTFGRPYDDQTSYVGWLRELLAEVDSARRWEVINCGGISYASYRLARIMDELAAYDPDVFIIYTGHNEFLEDRTYEKLRKQNVLSRMGARAVSRLRTATVIDGLLSGYCSRRPREATGLMPDEVDAILDHTAGPETYARDPEHTRDIIRHFRLSLARMCRNGKAAGARVILVKPASNLRDFSPFKSEYSIKDFGATFTTDLQLTEGQKLLDAGDAVAALRLFEQALAVDTRYARAAYLAGRAAFKAGECEKAERYFRIARDEDVCPLRAPSAILQAVEEVAREQRVPVIDFPAIVRDHASCATGCPVPGSESFLDHVHPTIETHLQLAMELLRTLASSGMLTVDDTLPEIALTVSDRVTAGIDQTRHAMALSNLSQVLSWAGRNDEALRVAAQARDKAPEEVEILAQLGRLYDKTGRSELARQTYERALQLAPENPLVLFRLGRACMAKGDYRQAVELLEKSAKNTPLRAPRAHRIRLLRNLGSCYQQLGRHNQAEEMYRRARIQ